MMQNTYSHGQEREQQVKVAAHDLSTSECALAVLVCMPAGGVRPLCFVLRLLVPSRASSSRGVASKEAVNGAL